MEDTLSHLSRCILLILLATGMAAVACERPEPVTTGDLEVVVTGENGVPLPGVKLGLGSEDYKYATDAKGSFLFKDLDEGFIRLYGRAEGYHDGTILAKVVAGETSRCDFPLNKVEPYLRWNYEGGATVDTYAAKGHTGIIIESNISWAVDGDPGNITFHQREGSGDGSIDFEWDFPESIQFGDTLSRNFFVKGAGLSLEVKVLFHVPIRILNISAMELNRLNHQDEDITGQVEFNRRVKCVDFRPNYGAEPIRLRASDQEERIYPFSFKCGMVPDLLFVGLEAQSVNNDGLTFQDDSIALPLWDRREIIEGFIIHTWLSADETYIWATTVNPNRVCKIDTRSLEVVKRFDLPFGPGDLAYSYANDRLYVIDKDNSRVVVIRPDNGKSVKTIRVTDNPFDDPDPICTPYRILFADNGYGILTLYDESSRYRWRIIDSREDDRLSVHPDCMQHFADGVEAFSYDAIDNWEICDLDLDHTRTRIIAGPPMERKYMHFFNSVDNTHESVLTPYRIMRFDSSREKDAVLLMLIDGMTVLNRESGTLTPKSNYGDSSYFPYDFAADFCYGLAGDDIRTYLISEGWVFTMDNTHCAPLFKAGGKEVGFNRLIAFRTGDRLLLIRNAFASGTELIEFDAERFAPGD